MTFKRILAATDLSGNAMAAVRLAGRLASGSSPLHVVHVATDTAGPPTVGRPHVLGRGESAGGVTEMEAESALRHHTTEAGAGDAELRVRQGDVADQVAQAAEDADADLVVIGATGETGWRAAFLGSTARDIVRSVPAHVLVARGEPPATGPLFRRIMVAVDFHERSRHAARYARALARDADADLVVAHVVDPAVTGMAGSAVDLGAFGGPHQLMDASHVQDTMRDALHRFNREVLGGEAHEELLTARPETGIVNYAETHDVDLVVVGTHNAGAIERFLLGSVAEHVTESAPSSVLVVREAGPDADAA